MLRHFRERMDTVVRYMLYPLLLAATVAFAMFAITNNLNLGQGYGYYLVALIGVLVAIEALHPLRAEWRMTTRTFLRRDLPFMLIGGATINAVNYTAGILAARFDIAYTVAQIDLPLIPAFLVALYASDFVWYWVHRASHEMKGNVGRFLWRTHAAHHLPQQVYVLMHAVGHPINAIMVRSIIALPLYFMGFSPEVVFLVIVFNNLQGIVSHFNVDSRAGWLNYLIVGTELHRYHHSADPEESKNYAAVVTLWDQLFGTFYYRPESIPHRLGVNRPEDYPNDNDILKVLTLPFVSTKSPTATETRQEPMIPS